MKALRIVLIVIAWIGLLGILAGVVISFWISITMIQYALEGRYAGWEGPGLGIGYILAIALGTAGFVLTLPGGLVAKPRYLGTALIIFGVLFIVSYIGALFVDTEGMYKHYVIKPNFTGEAELPIILIPGLPAIIEGIFINRLRKKLQKPLIPV